MHLLASFPAIASGYDTLTLPVIIWGAIGGIAVGTVASLIGRRIPGVFIKNLHRAGAVSAEKAVTLADLGMEKNFILRRALRDGQTLRKYVTLANPDDFAVKSPNNSKFSRVMRKIFSLPEKDAATEIDFSRARFFITDEARFTAEVRYNGKGADLLGVFLSLILLAALGFFLQWILPELIALVGGLLPQ